MRAKRVEKPTSNSFFALAKRGHFFAGRRESKRVSVKLGFYNCSFRFPGHLLLASSPALFLATLVTICKVEKVCQSQMRDASTSTLLLLCLFGKWSCFFFWYFCIFFFLGYVRPSGQLLLVTLSCRPKICLGFPRFLMFVVVALVFCLFHA